MARVLIVYASRHGHTGHVVERLAAGLRRAGHEPTRWRADHPVPSGGLREFDAAVLAAPVYYGRYPRAIVRFIRRHLEALDRLPTAFLSVCGAAAASDEAARLEAARYPARLHARTGWLPSRVEIVAGTVAYTKYDPITRWIMRRISRAIGRPTDTSRDHEFTDWAALDRFAASFGGTLPQSATPELLAR